MSRVDDFETGDLYATAAKWKNESLTKGSSLLWPGEMIWTLDVLEAFKSCFIDKPDTTADSFDNKFHRQLKDQPNDVVKLACELLLVYFLFSSSVTAKKKKSVIGTVAGWNGLSFNEELPAANALEQGIGATGQAYNTRRPFELKFIAELALRLVQTNVAEREAILLDPWRTAAVLDEVEDEATSPSKHALLHLMFPDNFEATASIRHKERVAETFGEFVTDGDEEEILDKRLLRIRESLEKLLPGQRLNFYHDPLKACWYSAGDVDEISPLQALEIKRQIVLYGPPGTGKTHEAKSLAATLVRQGLLHFWKPKRYFTEKDAVQRLVSERVRRVQLHPGFGYEDLIRGIHLTDGGKTDYRSGVLLKIIEDLELDKSEERNLPFVVILDEMNRADLSKVLGECFSLLEDREGTVQLAGQDKQPRLLRMPPNVYFIGTMNLIDQSLEQVDFALRRRFLWFFRGFEKDDFLAVSKFRWDQLHAAKKIKKQWHQVAEDFDILAERAEALNDMVSKHNLLGEQYQIGHTYFCDVVFFVARDSKNTVRPLFKKKNEARLPVVNLWRYSLSPLLEQYLSGAEAADRKDFLENARAKFVAADA